jgi:hypothetical protein
MAEWVGSVTAVRVEFAENKAALWQIFQGRRRKEEITE